MAGTVPACDVDRYLLTSSDPDEDLTFASLEEAVLAAIELWNGGATSVVIYEYVDWLRLVRPDEITRQNVGGEAA